MSDPASIIRPVTNTLRWLVVATVVLYAALAVVTLFFVLPPARESHDALCALRGDLERRVQTSEAFLRLNPKGVPGIPARTIRDGIVNQRRTIDELGEVSC